MASNTGFARVRIFDRSGVLVKIDDEESSVSLSKLFQRATNWCKTFKQGDIVHKKDTHTRTHCIFPKQAVLGESHYMFSSKRKGETYNCEILRQQGKTGEYYWHCKCLRRDAR